MNDKKVKKSGSVIIVKSLVSDLIFKLDKIRLENDGTLPTDIFVRVVNSKNEFIDDVSLPFLT